MNLESPKMPLKNPHWSKNCLRPHTPLTIGNSSSVPSANIGTTDSTTNINESGSNRTLKRFMTMKKSKANEFLKRGFINQHQCSIEYSFYYFF